MYLALINGPCGVGKSETSRALAAGISGSEWLRLDDLRKTIPEERFMKDGMPDAVARMWHANEIGRSLAKRTLSEGNTVIVDAIKYQAEWVEPWEIVGKEAGATVLDICLTAPKEVVMARAEQRGYKPGGRLTPDKVSTLYDKVVAFYVDRPDAILIDTTDLTVPEVKGLILARHMPAVVPDNSYIE